jgi:hypothetical protein
MMLLHCTLESRFWKSIDKEGLDPARAQTRRKVVWLVRRRKLAWALAHLRKIHGWGKRRAVVLVVDLPATWLRRLRPCVYLCARKIPPERILHVWTQEGLTCA